jgi:hypothetical protein
MDMNLKEHDMKKQTAFALAAALLALGALSPSSVAAPVTEITLTKPRMRWLWGGFGFHNSEATMAPMMSDEFRDQRVLKSFREIAPSYSRLFAGFHDWTQEAMDAFADYYDATFRRAGTTLYLVPGRMPVVTDDFDFDRYCEDVASRLEYLVKTRGCRKIRYYALTNEMASGPTWGWFSKHRDVYEKLCRGLYAAFRRHGLDIGLMTPDSAMPEHLDDVVWATKAINDVTEVYCWHYYDRKAKPGEAKVYGDVYGHLTNLVALCLGREKRVSLGEWGMTGPIVPYREGHMRDDGHGGWRWPMSAFAREVAICRAEMGLAAMNAGALNAVSWTFVDYPDPFLREDGDTPGEKARYDVARFSGWGLDVRYNKNGLFRWDDETRDYSSYPDLYTMGWLVKLFRKGARVLEPAFDDADLRVGAVTNPDGSCSVAVVNWGAAKTVRIASEHPLAKPLRVYEYDSAKPPMNAFNDLQPAKGTVAATDGAFEATLPPRSMTFFTTDYVDRVPAPVAGVRLGGDGALVWNAASDPDHVYYRVFRDGGQIASTVATRLDVKGAKGDYAVRSVDRWGNVSKK